MAFDLEALRVFANVAEQASFTAAAGHLGLAKARVSTRVQRLEAGLGTRLFHRTTRRVRLTPDGEQFLERCRELLGQADELQAMFQRDAGQLVGRLRIDLPNGLARSVVIPRLPEFLAAHPRLVLELSSTDRRVDPVHEGFDCVLRVGQLADSTLVARPLGTLRLVNCASLAYLAQRGTPRTIADLAQHRLVHYATVLGGTPDGFVWRDGAVLRVQPMAGTITVNSSDAYNAACVAGLGLTQAPALGLQAAFDAGALVEVLPEFTAPPMPVSLVYPNRRQLPKRVEAVMDWLATVLRPHLDAADGGGE